MSEKRAKNKSKSKKNKSQAAFHRFQNKTKICYGVDLNRNFDSNFGGKDARKNPCSTVYPGKYGRSS